VGYQRTRRPETGVRKGEFEGNRQRRTKEGPDCSFRRPRGRKDGRKGETAKTRSLNSMGHAWRVTTKGEMGMDLCCQPALRGDRESGCFRRESLGGKGRCHVGGNRGCCGRLKKKKGGVLHLQKGKNTKRKASGGVAKNKILERVKYRRSPKKFSTRPGEFEGMDKEPIDARGSKGGLRTTGAKGGTRGLPP